MNDTTKTTASTEPKTEPKTETKPETKAETKTAAKPEVAATEAKVEAAAETKSPFGAWAVPNFAQFTQLPQMPTMPDFSALPGLAQLQEIQAKLTQNLTTAPGMAAAQAHAKQQIEQVHKFIDDCAVQEHKAVEQFKTWLGDVHKLQSASIDYAVTLQTEARKLAKAQLEQLAKAVGPQH